MIYKSKALVFFFLFLLALVVFPSFAALVGTVISCFFQAIAAILIVNIIFRVALLAFKACFGDKTEEAGTYKFA